MPKISYLLPGQRATGWIAVSLYHLKTSAGYRWLNEYAPVTTVGRSIQLYHVMPVAWPPAE
jgi:hypothetical protein